LFLKLDKDVRVLVYLKRFSLLWQVCRFCLSKMPADSFCLVDSNVIEIERRERRRVVKKHSMKEEIERS